MLEPSRKEILRSHLAGGYGINRATRNVLAAERVPGKIDGRQSDGGNVIGERFVVDAGDDPLPLPALRATKAFVASPRFDVNQPVAHLMRMSANALDQPNAPGRRRINQQADAAAVNHS